MRWIALAAIVCFSLPAFAQTDVPDDKDRIQFIDLTTMYLDGQRTKAQGMFFEAKQRPVFKSLVDLKRDFLPRMVATRSDLALR